MDKKVCDYIRNMNEDSAQGVGPGQVMIVPAEIITVVNGEDIEYQKATNTAFIDEYVSLGFVLVEGECDSDFPENTDIEAMKTLLTDSYHIPTEGFTDYDVKKMWVDAMITDSIPLIVE